jgi:hypothetical protein
MPNFLGFLDDLPELVGRVRVVCAGAMAPGDSSWCGRRITPSWYGRCDDGAVIDWRAGQRGLTGWGLFAAQYRTDATWSILSHHFALLMNLHLGST